MSKISDFRGEYRWLSNFHLVEVKLDGLPYPSTEHAYQAAKTLDIAERLMIQALPTCGQAKRTGQRLKLRDDWEQVKVSIMLDLLRQKFARGTLLGQQLDATGDRQLVEGNWWGDTFWGVCGGVGENQLGKLLMQVRAEGRLL